MSVCQVRPRLFLSGLDSAVNPAVLNRRNISLIVNVSGVDSVIYPDIDGLQILNIPIPDEPHAPLRSYFDSVADRIHSHTQEAGNTLVHCTAGRSRSPSLIMAYLIRYERLSLREAYESILSVRPFIRPNAGFWRQLIGYEREVLGLNSVRMGGTSVGVLPQVMNGDYCVNV